MEVGLKAMLDMRQGDRDWRPPIVRSVATRGEGISLLLAALDRHHAYLREEHLIEKWSHKGVRARIVSMVNREIREGFWTQDSCSELDGLVGEVVARRQTPGGAARALLALAAGR